jgi:hypothetical protein
MASKFSVHVPGAVFRDYPEVSRVVTYMIEEWCDEGAITAIAHDDVHIMGMVRSGNKPKVFKVIRLLNELGYNKPTFVNVRSPQEYAERLAGHAKSVAVRIAPEVAPLLSGDAGTHPQNGEEQPRLDGSD